MKTADRIYHEEDPEYIEEAKRKQETTKKFLHLLLIQPEIVTLWKTSYGINIIPESVEIVQIDLEDYSNTDDRLNFEFFAVTQKRCLFVAKLNEKSYQVEYTCEISCDSLTIHLEPAEYSIDYAMCKTYTVTKNDKKKVIFSGEGV